MNDRTIAATPLGGDLTGLGAAGLNVTGLGATGLGMAGLAARRGAAEPAGLACEAAA